MSRALRVLALLLSLAVVVSCEEADPSLVVRIGISTLAILDPTLAPQRVDPDLTDAEAPIQLGRWEIEPESATLFVQDVPVDLTFKSDCAYTDGAFSLSPVAEGACSDGIVLEATAEPQAITLQLVLRPILARAEPVPWTPGGDFDGDGVTDAADNCPLLHNPGQEDDFEDGIGDVCSRIDFATGLPARDSDGDGVLDRIDNCVWKSNPDQANTTGLGTGTGVTDGIGDACVEQQTSPGEVTLTLGPLPFQQPLAGGSLFVVDFRATESLELQSCTWSEGTPGPCPFDPGAVRFCTSTSVNVLATGCL